MPIRERAEKHTRAEGDQACRVQDGSRGNLIRQATVGTYDAWSTMTGFDSMFEHSHALSLAVDVLDEGFERNLLPAPAFRSRRFDGGRRELIPHVIEVV